MDAELTPRRECVTPMLAEFSWMMLFRILLVSFSCFFLFIILCVSTQKMDLRKSRSPAV